MPSSWLFVLPLLAGAAAVYLLLPRPRAYPALLGALIGAAAVGLAGWLIVGLGALTPETFLFYVFSATAVGFGALLVTQRNPARAALSFALVVLSTCGLFLLLAAPFLMAATIIIYAGAVIVTFLFVLMLAQQEGPSDADARSREPMLATAIGFVLLGALLYVLQVQWGYGTGGDGKVLDDVLRNVRDAAAGLRDDHLTGPTAPQFGRDVMLKPLYDAIGAKEKALDPKEARSHPALSAAEGERLRGEDAFLTEVRTRLENIFRKWQEWRPPEEASANDATAQRLDEAKKNLKELELVVLQAKERQGWPQPAGGDNLSAFSGPPPNLPADQVRADADGRPPLPADNPGNLGRSLFTDYLLPVELAGFLLLAAAIGAIAIAHRRTTPEGT
jgi:NADH-quinone oxidoreductase subunit J